eukprot:scpid66479/ scgid7318/ Dehydrodolichyl diphosphate synthase
MELARKKFEQLIEEKELINKHGVCVRVLGDLSLLPHDVQVAVARAVDISKHNSRANLNVCFAYTSRHEMANAMQLLGKGVEDGLLLPGDIDEDLFEKCLYTRHSPDPDLLIRTSGEVRLSDFLLWQTSFCCLHFTQVLWPEFSSWDLFAAVLHYQREYNSIKHARSSYDQRRLCPEVYEQLLRAEKQCLDQDTPVQSEGRQRRIDTFVQMLTQEEVSFREALLT